jgi:hypothetical protein
MRVQDLVCDGQVPTYATNHSKLLQSGDISNFGEYDLSFTMSSLLIMFTLIKNVCMMFSIFNHRTIFVGTVPWTS